MFLLREREEKIEQVTSVTFFCGTPEFKANIN